MDTDYGKHLLGMVYWLHTPWKFLESPKFPELLCGGKGTSGNGIADEVARWCRELEGSISHFKSMGIRYLRINISWAEYRSPNGPALLAYYLPKLAADFNLLPCLNYTPPDIAEQPRTNAPPKDLSAFGEFVDELLSAYPQILPIIQLWNEPNLNTDWDPDLDRDGGKFPAMIRPAAAIAKRRGVVTVLGGMNRLHLEWFERFCDRGGLEDIDIIGFNGLRATKTENSVPMPWSARIGSLREAVVKKTGKDLPIIITEAGYPTLDFRRHPFPTEQLERIQCAVFVSEVDAARRMDIPIFWYGLKDQSPAFETVGMATTGGEDPTIHHFGCISAEGRPKLLGKLLLCGGPAAVFDRVDKNGLRDLASVVIDRSVPVAA